MRAIAIVLLLAVALPAHGQMYRCVDAKGKRSYSDKPGPGCVLDTKMGASKAPASGTATGTGAPSGGFKPGVDPLAESAKAAKAQGGRKPPPKPAPPPKAAPKPPPETKAQLEGRCTGMRQQRDWLASPRGESVPGRDAQLAQINKALRDCP
jgi:Domain of unknown function (DUF4124)